MKVIDGGYHKGAWCHDGDAYSDEEIKLWNERLKQLGQGQHAWLLAYLWDTQPKKPSNHFA